MNNPIMYSDPSGNMPKWAEWLIGGAFVVAAVALTIWTAGAGTAAFLASTMGGGFWASVCCGLFAGIQYGLSASKIANSVSGLGKAHARLNNAYKPLSNVKNLANAPFGGSNIAKTIGQFVGNYSSAYSSYAIANVTNSVVKVGSDIAYFLLESFTSDLIGSLF